MTLEADVIQAIQAVHHGECSAGRNQVASCLVAVDYPRPVGAEAVNVGLVVLHDHLVQGRLLLLLDHLAGLVQGRLFYVEWPFGGLIR